MVSVQFFLMFIFYEKCIILNKLEGIMAERSKTIQRAELYEQVWKVPISKLAEKYGISGVALKKICKKLNVPTPPRGYWARIQSGQRLPKTPLPKKKYGTPSSHEILTDHAIAQRKMAEVPSDEDLPDQLKALRVVKVPKTLRNPHPLVENTNQFLSKAKPDDYGVFRVRKNNCVDLRVSPRMLNRSLRIWDGLLKCFEELDYEIITESGYDSQTSVVIFDEKVEISLKEKVHRLPHVLTQKEIEKQKRYSWERPGPWDYEPTGRLTLSIGGYVPDGFRKNWSDTKKRELEILLGDFVKAVYRVALTKRDRTIEQEEDKRRWQEELRRRQEEAERLEREKKRLLDLEDQAERWVKAEKLRAYLKEVEKVVTINGLSEIQGVPVQEWMRWALEHADRIDPLK
jgi:hypothetical protein